MSTEAQKRASTNYNRKQDNIMIRPNKEEGAAIRAAAAAAGVSVQAYILRAVRAWMEHERAGSVPGGLPVSIVDPKDQQRAPQGIMEGTGDIDEAPEDTSSPAGTPARQTIAAVSHTQDEKSSPAKLSPDDWAEWARRRDDEPLDDWKIRLKKSNIGTSTIDIMKRIGKLPKPDRDLILGTDPAAGRGGGTGR